MDYILYFNHFFEYVLKKKSLILGLRISIEIEPFAHWEFCGDEYIILTVKSSMLK